MARFAGTQRRGRLPAWEVAAAFLLGLAGCVGPPWDDKDAGRPPSDLERRARRHNRLRLPDLSPTSARRRFVLGEDVQFAVEVENRGRGLSGSFQVVAEVTVPGQATQTFTQTVMSLAAGTDVDLEMGLARVPLAPRPVDVMVSVRVDPSTPGAPRGSQIESDESNNLGVFTFTVF